MLRPRTDIRHVRTLKKPHFSLPIPVPRTAPEAGAGDRRRIVISPHLDDAVLGCGQWLAGHPGTTVITLFAGMPDDGGQSTDWDRRCGFASAEDAMTARWEEDCQALALLQSTALWLEFRDSQYGRLAAPRQVADRLVRLLQSMRPHELFLPLGLFHADHLVAHEAAALALRDCPVATAWAYEDALYRAMPGLLQQRLAQFEAEGIQATPIDPCTDGSALPLKRRAVDCYASQLRALKSEDLEDAWRPERLWKLEGGAFRRHPRGAAP